MSWFYRVFIVSRFNMSNYVRVSKEIRPHNFTDLPPKVTVGATLSITTFMPSPIPDYSSDKMYLDTLLNKKALAL